MHITPPERDGQPTRMERVTAPRDFRREPGRRDPRAYRDVMSFARDRFAPTFGAARGRGDGEDAGRQAELPIYRFLDLSTAHLAADDLVSLCADGDEMPRFVEHEYGGFMNVPDADAEDPEDDDARRALAPSVQDVIDFARAHQCTWVNFDADARTVEHLPTYEW
jgi:hypothetical protein